jgi:ubiquinol-cytochrome c reductase cytochrome c1 subunit
MPMMAAASGGAHLYKAPIDINDKESLRRGAKAFADYCYSCHAASFMRFNRIAKDLEMSEDEVREMMIHTRGKKGDPTKIGELMKVSMTEDYAKNAFGTTVPDLSLTARARGADWVYSYLRSFYVDPYRPTGFNNTVFPDVGMPHVLWSLQGLQEPVYKTVMHGNVEVEELEGFEQIQAGKLSRVEYDMFLGDLTNFMVYLAEPVQVERRSLGWKVLLFLIVLFGFAYALKKEYWKDVH